MTLIEILVALGILAAVAVVFLLGMSTSSKAVMVSQERVAIDSLAKSQMEDAMARPYDAMNPYPTIAIPQDLVSQYGITVQHSPVHATDDGLQRITVTITRNGQTAFTLVGLKTNR
jgi:type II secretory pathway pseudopilin PulG